MNVDLPPETWRAIHGMLMEAPVPPRIAFPVVQQFEQALQAAQQPAASDDKESMQ